MVSGTFRETKLYTATNINMHICRERTIRSELPVLHRKLFNKGTTVVGLKYMEKTYMGDVHFSWLLLLPGFLPLVLPVICGLLHDAEIL